MKTIFTMLLLYSGLILAQTVADSTQTSKRNQESEQFQNQKQEINRAQEQIGPKGNPNADGNVTRKKKDVFIFQVFNLGSSDGFPLFQSGPSSFLAVEDRVRGG